MSYIGKAPVDRTLGLSQKNVFTGDGSTTTFDMTTAAPEGGDTAVDVFVDNVRQEPGTSKAYVIAQDGSGDYKRITFSTAPASAAVIWTNNRLRTQITNVLPGTGTVGKTLLNDNVITGQTEVSTLASADTFMVYDDSASAMKKVTYANVHTAEADMEANTVKVRDAASTGSPSNKTVADTQLLIGDGTGFTAAALSSDVTMTNAGAVTIAADAVTYSKMQNLSTANRVLGSASTGLIGEVQIATDMIADNAVDGSKIALTSDAAGDVMYYNGTNYVRLAIGTASQLLRTNSGATAPEWATIIGAPTWVIKTAAYTASSGDGVMVDTSSSAITIELPASPTLGDFVRIMDYTGDAATNNITVDRNSEKIQGTSADLTIATARAAIGLVFSNTAQGWLLMEN